MNEALKNASAQLATNPSILEIKDHPDVVTSLKELRQKSRETTIEECEKLGLWDKMRYILDNSPNAAAVAAVQIGYPLRATLARFVTTDGKTEDVRFVNPVITQAVGFLTANEGCLSLPGRSIRTGRSANVVVKDDIAGTQSFGGICAVVMQHEIDHMDGKLMTDRSVTGTIRRPEKKVGRNDPCPCGAKGADGKPRKYKKCCMA